MWKISGTADLLPMDNRNVVVCDNGTGVITSLSNLHISLLRFSLLIDQLSKSDISLYFLFPDGSTCLVNWAICEVSLDWWSISFEDIRFFSSSCMLRLIREIYKFMICDEERVFWVWVILNFSVCIFFKSIAATCEFCLWWMVCLVRFFFSFSGNIAWSGWNNANFLLTPRMQYVKCGFAGENFPTSVFPCVVGRPMLRYEESLIEQELTVSLLFFAFIHFWISIYRIASVRHFHYV